MHEIGEIGMALFFKQLQHTQHPITISMDEGRYLFSVRNDQGEQSYRLTKLQFAILTVLFREHPQMVTYKVLKNGLQSQKVSLVDDTRLHRKVSELRLQLKRFNPMLENFIQNLRGVGYHLAEEWKEAVSAPKKQEISTQIQNEPCVHQLELPPLNLQDCLEELSKLMAKSIELTNQGMLTALNHYCVVDRDPYDAQLKEIEATFLAVKARMMEVFSRNIRSVFQARLSAGLEHLYTYLSLSCISDYMVPHDQWCAWFEQDVKKAYEKVVLTVKDIEAVSQDPNPSAHKEVAFGG